jgi:uncharacterized protein (TIGR03435 family)
MTNRISPALTLPRRALILATAAAAVAGPVFIGMWNAPRGLAQSEEKLVFEVAAIKRIDPAALGGGPRPLAPAVMRGGGIRSQVSIFNLMCWAYRIDGAQLSGGPSWVRSDLYDIQAKAEKFEGPDDPTVPISEQQANRTRERVKALLAERFHLAVRTESKEAPVFILSVAKGGHKLTPEPEGRGGVRRGAGVIEGFGAPISFLAVPLTQMLGRPVLDETGIEGRFKFKLEYKPVDPQELRGLAQLGTPLADDDPRPSIYTAIKDQLGLELQTRKGPVASIVIERIERPTEN